ncbi:SLBB domain-containing protein [Rhodoferax sp.]|uniref:polysaccharide biosynthesis/export family protein n=1 Tax=Rhodoferax sp. TaxID=50421 RepID=UPI002628D83D|nr:SLBB domain-containing protein [Rhodoferax sp.]MDD4944229.1 SLBB domain-containing protein [Rhodoferax sp.]
MTTGSMGSSATFAPAATSTSGAPSTATTTTQTGDALLFNSALQSPAKANAKASLDAPTDATLTRPPQRVAGPNQFQSFVQETTGRLLPVYGRDLFNSPQTYAANTTVPAPDNYILGPGDEIQLQVSGLQDISTSLIIDRNGQVNLPKVGSVTLAGVAVRDLEKTLTGHLGKIFTNFKASATLGRLRSIQVYVVGQAQQPGTFQLSSLSTLVNALFASGGPSANGSMRAIELKRSGKTVTTLDLYDFIAKGDKSHDLPLMAGDVIVIPSVGPRVAVTGAFDQAAIFELKPGTTTVGDILNLGGGVPTLATSQKALLERITRSSTPPRQIQEIMLDPAGLLLPLQDGDVLTLLGISPAFGNTVTLQGTVAAPLRYRWFEGMRILDLIPEREALITSDYYKRKNLLVQNAEAAKTAGGNVSNQIRNLVDQINWDYAVIERLDRNQLTNKLIPFNLGKAVLQKDPAHNLLLHAGDVVTILNQSDLRVPQERQSRLVRVEGEVAVPGVYQAAAGETLPQLIKRIGGLTPQAYVFGIELSRESVKVRQQENLDKLILRLEAQSQSQQGTLLANRNNTGTTDQTAAILQVQQAQLKSQIERLKSFKSSGRMALELDPRGQTLAALPNLPLEDGDRILVPNMPGFVSAFGSVNNENVFIYKAGKTVADVIRSAGLTEDAEPGQAFVLRADGSIVARNSNTWFGGNFESLALMPGDTLVVPAMMDRETRYNTIVRGFKDWTQILGNLGLGIAAFRSMGY